MDGLWYVNIILIKILYKRPILVMLERVIMIHKLRTSRGKARDTRLADDRNKGVEVA